MLQPQALLDTMVLLGEGFIHMILSVTKIEFMHFTLGDGGFVVFGDLAEFFFLSASFKFAQSVSQGFDVVFTRLTGSRLARYIQASETVPSCMSVKTRIQTHATQ